MTSFDGSSCRAVAELLNSTGMLVAQASAIPETLLSRPNPKSRQFDLEPLQPKDSLRV